MGDSAKITIVVDRHGTVPECAVRIREVSDSALLPHVAPAAATLAFVPARSREGPAASTLRMTLHFGTPEQLQRAQAAGRRVELRVEQPPVLEPGAPMPAYPDELREERRSGRVVIEADVTTDGRIDLSTVRVVSSDHRAFTASVRAILPSLRFQPARVGPGGPAIVSHVQLPFEFRAP